MTRLHATRTIIAIAALTMAANGCGAAKDKIVEDALEDSGVELNDLGKSLPESFPADVPTPTDGVELESAVATGDTFVMRYGLTDPAAATAAYRSALESAGFTIEADFNDLEGTANNVGFTATNGTWDVSASAFGEGEVDGLYMGVSVLPAG
jgi:hypothetical protein